VSEQPHSQVLVQLRVTYQSPRSLIGEFTRSVGQGEVVLESRRPLQLGTRFDLELRARGVAEPAQVLGEVFHCIRAPGPPGRYELGIRYTPGADLRGLDGALKWIADSQASPQRRRQHPRIPLVMLAGDHASAAPRYLLRDLSQEGAGAELLPGGPPPRELAVGAASLLELPASSGPLLLHGEVAWVTQPQGRARNARATFGLRFGRLRPGAAERLEQVLRLRGLPPPPWRARLSFGMDAVARMP
jgi:PilZ domain-containing protein